MTRKAIIGLVRAAALSGALFLAVAAIPIAGGFAMLFAPAPILIFAVGRLSPNLRAIASVLLAGALVAVAAGISAGITYGISFGLASVLMCYMLERQCSFEIIVLVTAGTMLIAGSAAALVAAGSPDAMLTAIHQSLKAGMERGQEFYKTIGMDAGLPPDTQAAAIDIFIRLSPALAAIAAAATVMLNLSMFWRWAGKKRLPYDLFGELPKWSTPEWLVWVLLAAGFAFQGFKYLIPDQADRDYRARRVHLRGDSVFLPGPRHHVVLFQNVGDADGGAGRHLRNYVCSAGAGSSGLPCRGAGYVD